MPSKSRLVSGLLRLFTPRTGQRSEQAGEPPQPESPGRSGAAATFEVDPHTVKNLRLDYCPVTDGDPDPGEIVWTWVPYQERDGRGKDRPVLIVAAEPGETVLAVQLTSKDHDDDRGDFVPLGSGDWDAKGRESWVSIERLFRVHTAGMRREAAALDETRFSVVARALHNRYGWR